MRAAEIPLLEQPASFQEQSEAQKREERLVRAFLRQRYPLSEEGIVLRQELEAVRALDDTKKIEALVKQLPTVERPRLELFRDFALSPEQEENIFGQGELANVQVTKGCRHQCTFCAAGAAKKVEIMPFPAVLKIAEKKQARDKKTEVLWAPGRADLVSQVTNYYDSDPFDYRDATFLHEDGTPADFSDVVQALASHVRPIHFTTAGWPLSDQVAQRAAERLAALCKEDRDLLSGPRISVNKYEATARRSFQAYTEMMLRVIQTLNDIGPEVLLFADAQDPQDQQFIREVIEQIRPRLGRHDLIQRYWSRWGSYIDRAWTEARKNHYRWISLFSGPMAKADARDDHHDVMSCLPGIHIWPDGTVALQARKKDGEKGLQVPKGSRPRPIGIKLYELGGNGVSHHL